MAERGFENLAKAVADDIAGFGKPSARHEGRTQRPANPNAQTFPGGQWQDVAPGTPSPLVEQQRRQQLEPAQIDPRVLQGLLGLVSGGKMSLPSQMLTGAPQRAQLDTAPQFQQIEAAHTPQAYPHVPTRAEVTARQDASDPGDTVDTRKKRGSESFGNYLRHHKKTTATLAAFAMVATGWGVLRANGQTTSDVTNFVTGQSAQGTLVLAALDCGKPLLTSDVEGEGDIKWKMKVALVADVAKAKANKNFKLPTKDTFLPTAKLPAVSFPETAEEKEQAKTIADRDLRIMYRNTVEVNACDIKKTAFKNDGSNSVTVNLADISLFPKAAAPGAKDAAKNAKDEYETRAVADAKDSTGQYVTAPGESKRLMDAMKPGATINLRNEFFGKVMDGMNEGECKTEIRTQLRDYIEADIKQQAKKQGQSVEVKFNGDVKMPGEAYRQGKAAALINSPAADIENANISCQNVKLVQTPGGTQ